MGRSRGVRGERTEHTKTFRRTLAGFGLTWGQKVDFSTFSGKLAFQCTRNGLQKPPFCPGSLQDTFIIYSSILHQHIFRTYLAERNKNENLKCEHLKIPKPRFTDRCPDMSDTSFQKGTVTAFPRVDPWGEAPAKNPHWGGRGGGCFPARS